MPQIPQHPFSRGHHTGSYTGAFPRTVHPSQTVQTTRMLRPRSTLFRYPLPLQVRQGSCFGARRLR